MDHLPLPSNPSLGSEVPYLCTEDYDGGPFESYPARSGWTWNRVDGWIEFQRHGKYVCKDQVASFLQTWLYFGLLSETLGRWDPSLQKKFVADGDSTEKRLTTERLERIVIDWSGRLAGVPRGMSWPSRLGLYFKEISRLLMGWLHLLGLPTRPNTRRKELEELEVPLDRFRKCLEIIQGALFLFYHHRDGHDDSEVYQLLALMALASYLTITWHRIYSHHTGQIPKDLAPLEIGKFITNKYLAKHMCSKEQNWCRSDVEKIIGSRPSSTIWYYANMSAPRKDLEHNDCTESVCKRTMIGLDVEQYELAHTEPKCECPTILAGSDPLNGVLSYGAIPVLKSVEGCSLDDYEVTVLPSSKQPYVAISHVWAEGLGDPKDNALHACEIKRLFTLIRELPGSEPEKDCLWIDTMCVPVEDGDLKKLAMMKMKETYALAKAVLVLDKYVLDFEAKRSSPLEAFARVANSTWMHRLWTLQEGRLSKHVWFQFADGPVRLPELYHLIPRSPFPARGDYAVNVDITMSYRASTLSLFKEEEVLFRPLYDGLLATRSAVMSRAVSRYSDEPVCLAFLMDLDIDHVNRAKYEDRMTAFWELLPVLPLSLVFSKAPRKLAARGFRWAPSTFLGPIPGEIHDWWAGPDELWGRIEAKPTRFGLLVNLPGLLFQPKRSRNGWSAGLKLGASYTFQATEGKWYAISLTAPWSHLTDGSAPDQMPESSAIILQAPLERDKPREEANLESSFSANALLNAVVGTVTREDDREFRVETMRHATVLQLDVGTSFVNTAMVRCARTLWDEHEPEKEREFMQSNDNKLSPEVVKACIALAKEALLEPDLLEHCREQRRSAGVGDDDGEIVWTLAGMMHQVFIEGYNSVEVRSAHQRWYVD